MQLLSVELRRLELELVRPMATSGGRHGRRPVLLVRVETDSAVGWGECAALEAPTYTEEYADGAEQVLSSVLVPMLLDARLEPRGAGAPGSLDIAGAADGTESLLRRLDAVRGHHMAKAALEMALLDAELRAAGRSLAGWLGATATHVRAGATVGIGRSDDVVAEVAAALAAGFTRVKCKVAPGSDVGQLAAVREAFPDLDLVVDANGAYRRELPEHAAALERLDGLGLVAIEQPLAAADLVGHAALAAALATPVVLDESIGGLGALEAAIALRACDGVSVKAPRLGGIAAARRAHDRCRAAGIGLAAGGMLETGLGRACALAVAALAGFDLPGDIGPSDRYFSQDLTAPHVLVDGMIAVPSGSGLGVEPIEEVVEAATVRARTFRAP